MCNQLVYPKERSKQLRLNNSVTHRNEKKKQNSKFYMSSKLLDWLARENRGKQRLNTKKNERNIYSNHQKSIDDVLNVINDIMAI